MSQVGLATGAESAAGALRLIHRSIARALQAAAAGDSKWKDAKNWRLLVVDREHAVDALGSKLLSLLMDLWQQISTLNLPYEFSGIDTAVSRAAQEARETNTLQPRTRSSILRELGALGVGLRELRQTLERLENMRNAALEDHSDHSRPMADIVHASTREEPIDAADSLAILALLAQTTDGNWNAPLASAFKSAQTEFAVGRTHLQRLETCRWERDKLATALKKPTLFNDLNKFDLAYFKEKYSDTGMSGATRTLELSIKDGTVQPFVFPVSVTFTPTRFAEAAERVHNHFGFNLTADPHGATVTLEARVNGLRGLDSAARGSVLKENPADGVLLADTPSGTAPVTAISDNASVLLVVPRRATSSREVKHPPSSGLRPVQTTDAAGRVWTKRDRYTPSHHVVQANETNHTTTAVTAFDAVALAMPHLHSDAEWKSLEKLVSSLDMTWVWRIERPTCDFTADMVSNPTKWPPLLKTRMAWAVAPPIPGMASYPETSKHVTADGEPPMKKLCAEFDVYRHADALGVAADTVSDDKHLRSNLLVLLQAHPTLQFKSGAVAAHGSTHENGVSPYDIPKVLTKYGNTNPKYALHLRARAVGAGHSIRTTLVSVEPDQKANWAIRHLFGSMLQLLGSYRGGSHRVLLRVQDLWARISHLSELDRLDKLGHLTPVLSVAEETNAVTVALKTAVATFQLLQDDMSRYLRAIRIALDSDNPTLMSAAGKLALAIGQLRDATGMHTVMTALVTRSAAVRLQDSLDANEEAKFAESVRSAIETVSATSREIPLMARAIRAVALEEQEEAMAWMGEKQTETANATRDIAFGMTQVILGDVAVQDVGVLLFQTAVGTGRANPGHDARPAPTPATNQRPVRRARIISTCAEHEWTNGGIAFAPIVSANKGQRLVTLDATHRARDNAKDAYATLQVALGPKLARDGRLPHSKAEPRRHRKATLVMSGDHATATSGLWLDGAGTVSLKDRLTKVLETLATNYKMVTLPNRTTLADIKKKVTALPNIPYVQLETVAVQTEGTAGMWSMALQLRQGTVGTTNSAH
jgi:hypothetical protein